MTTAHTPGPWSAHLVRVQRCIHGPHGGPVAYTCGTERDDECDAANARLIAAAPDLLQALVKAREELACGNVNSAAERIAHAIERATGSAA